MRRALPLLAATLTLGACGRRAPDAAAVPPTMIRTAPVEDALVAQPIVATGTVSAKDAPTLSFKIGGIVGRVLVDDGDHVRAGQVLAVLDLREIDALVRKADEAVDRARREAERAERLYRDSVATLQQKQDAATALEVARADQQVAAVNRRYATIVAPAAGVVLKRHVEAGELVTAGAPVISLAAEGRGTVLRIGLADRDVVRIRRGDPATVTFDARPDVPLKGSVREIGAGAEGGTGTYEVEVAIASPPAWLASGMIGRARLEPREKLRARMVPVEAVLEADGERGAVFVLDASSAKALRRPVRIGFIDGGRVAVTGGLDGVRTVVTDGAAFLRDGSPVRRAASSTTAPVARNDGGAS